MLFVAAAVIGVVGFSVYRLHGIFGSNVNTSTPSGAAGEIVPFNPKTVVYEVFGDPGRQPRSATPTSTPVRSTSRARRCHGPMKTPRPHPR